MTFFKRRKWSALAAAFLFLCCFVGASNRGAAAPVAVTDDWGQTIRLSRPASRIIALYGAFAEMLCAMGAGDRLIARTQADIHPPEIQRLPSVGTHMRPNVELILGLKPDLVIQSASRRAATAEMERLVHAGIPVAVFHPTDFPSLFSCMERLGTLTGREAEAQETTAELRRRLEAVAARIHGARSRPRVVFEIRSIPLTVGGRAGMVEAVLEAAGAQNAVETDRAIVPFDVESLLHLDPDVYVVQEGPMNKNPTHPADRPHFDRLRAVREGRVFFVDEFRYSRPGPRAVDAVEELAARLFPERFGRGAPPADNPARSRADENRPESQTGGRNLPEPSDITWQAVLKRLVVPLLRLTFFIAVGLFVGNLIESFHWTHHLGRIARPLLRWGHLSDQSAVAFMAAFFSGVTANTLLMNAHQDGKLTRRELYFSNLVNAFPSYFLHLPTTFFILLPLVRAAGVYYLALTLLAALGRTFGALAVSRLVLPPPSPSAAPAADPPEPQARKDLFKDMWRKFRRRLLRVLRWTLPIYTLFFLLNHWGLFDWMELALARVFPYRIIPVEALSVVVFQVTAEFTAGAAAAGALMDAGTLTVKGTVLALLIGNVIATPVRALRHQLPYYMGIYTPKTGLSLLVVSQAVRVVSVVLVGWLFYRLVPA